MLYIATQEWRIEPEQVVPNNELINEKSLFYSLKMEHRSRNDFTQVVYKMPDGGLLIINNSIHVTWKTK